MKNISARTPNPSVSGAGLTRNEQPLSLAASAPGASRNEAVTAKSPDLELLEIIERSSQITQRGVAGEMRIALGLANSYLKRLARKGWIKVKQAPGRRWLYYLTPMGMSEKTRLTYEYIRYSALFYGEARVRCRRLFSRIVENEGRRRIAFLGRSDLAEIAYLSLQEFPASFAGIFDDAGVGEAFFGNPIQPLEAIAQRRRDFDALIYTRLQPPGGDPALAGIEYKEIV
ncbi:MAG: winged helix-turn-helix transcriptional regulator [Candidatus Sumerlaeota bacterium]|nr:winged helix-turn-helix transcriptional regulator [Candidatus Sumerlaeota bacterium]